MAEFREPKGSILGNHQLTKGEMEAVLAKCPYGTMAVNGANGYPCSIPMNIGWHDGFLYLHTADRGEKMENLRRDPRVCVNAYEEAGDIGQQPISAHKSVTVYGRVEILSGEDAVEGLRQIALSAGMPFKATDAYIMPRNKGIVVLRVRPEHMTGRLVKFGGMKPKNMA